MKIQSPKFDAQETLNAPSQADSLEGVVVAGLDWSGQDKLRLTLDSVRLEEADLTGAKFRDGGWHDLAAVHCQMGALDIGGSTWRRIELTGCQATGLVLSEVQIRDVVFDNCKLDLANFRFAYLQRVVFRGCSLVEADFSAATMSEVEFDHCQISAASFAGAKASQVSLASSQLTDLNGLDGLAGARISQDQLIALAPALAHQLGIIVEAP